MTEERVIESRKIFFENFKYKIGTVYKRYGSFEKFCEEENIRVIKSKKAKYSKKEIDDSIALWFKNGNSIPTTQKGLATMGLPSAASILKFYENWREPFEIYKALYEKMQ